MPRAPVAGHIAASVSRPTEMVTMDLVHMPMEKGCEYLLAVVGVFTKYGAAVPLTEVTSTAVLEALEQQVLQHGYVQSIGYNHVVDGGSEFQGVLEETVREAWGKGILPDGVDILGIRPITFSLNKL